MDTSTWKISMRMQLEGQAQVYYLRATKPDPGQLDYEAVHEHSIYGDGGVALYKLHSPMGFDQIRIIKRDGHFRICRYADDGIPFVVVWDPKSPGNQTNRLRLYICAPAEGPKMESVAASAAP